MRCWAVLFIFLIAGSLRADILHLRDGSRYYGTLVSQSDREVVFRVSLPDGSSAVVKRFPAALVKNIERTALTRPPVQTKPEAPVPLESASEDFEQMLREAYELIDDGDFQAAVLAFQHVVNTASETALEALDQQVRAARGKSLAEVLAETRLSAALAGRRALFELNYVTRYEADAMGRLLHARLVGVLGKSYQQWTVAQWAENPLASAADGGVARGLAADAHLAAAFIRARLKLDPQLKDNPAECVRLRALRASLSRLYERLAGQPGFHDLEKNDPFDPAAAALRRLEAAQAAASQPASRAAARPAPERDVNAAADGNGIDPFAGSKRGGAPRGISQSHSR